MLVAIALFQLTASPEHANAISPARVWVTALVAINAFLLCARLMLVGVIRNSHDERGWTFWLSWRQAFRLRPDSLNVQQNDRVFGAAECINNRGSCRLDRPGTSLRSNERALTDRDRMQVHDEYAVRLITRARYTGRFTNTKCRRPTLR